MERAVPTTAVPAPPSRDRRLSAFPGVGFSSEVVELAAVVSTLSAVSDRMPDLRTT
jgi:hypothetical protein